ncbi:MAG: VOC family protein [Geodermatophilaceae bacterium]
MAKTLQLTVDCADPGRLTRFWATALDYQIQPPPGGSSPGTRIGAASAYRRRNWTTSATPATR